MSTPELIFIGMGVMAGGVGILLGLAFLVMYAVDHGVPEWFIALVITSPLWLPLAYFIGAVVTS